MNALWMALIHADAITSPVWLNSWTYPQVISLNLFKPCLFGLLLLGLLILILWDFPMVDQLQISSKIWSGLRSKLDVNLSKLWSFMAALKQSSAIYTETLRCTDHTKAQVYTIHNLAVEITPESSPWESGQVIATLSRTAHATNTIIVVNNLDWVKNQLWIVLCTPTQWTCLEERDLNLITLNQEGPSSELVVTDYHCDNPFRARDMLIPTKNFGYIYIIISKSESQFHLHWGNQGYQPAVKLSQQGS
jgi:hypothetical protein